MNQSQGSNNFSAALLQPNPERDWFIVLSIAFVPFIFFISYATYLFFSVQSSLTLDKTTAAFPAETITAEEIQSVLETYRSRKARYEINVVPSVPTGTFNSIAPKSPQ